MSDPVDEDTASFIAMAAGIEDLEGGVDLASLVQPCAERLPMHVRIVVKDCMYCAIPNSLYEFEVDGERRRGTTDAGTLDEKVSHSASGAVLRVWDRGTAEAPRVWQLQIAPIEPLRLDEGARVRMANLAIIEHHEALGSEGYWRGVANLQRLFTAGKQGLLDTPTRATVASLYSADTSLNLKTDTWHLPDTRSAEHQLAGLTMTDGGTIAHGQR